MKGILSIIFTVLAVSLTACTTSSQSSAPLVVDTKQTSSSVQHHDGKITGYDTHEFHFVATQGQLLNISMATQAPFAYFNIYAPNYDEAIFNSSMEGEQFEMIAPTTGEYKVLVYQMRASARRNQTVPYRLEIIVGQ